MTQPIQSDFLPGERPLTPLMVSRTWVSGHRLPLAAVGIVVICLAAAISWYASRPQQLMSRPPLAGGTSVLASADLNPNNDDGDPWPFRELTIAGGVGETASDLVRREAAELTQHGWTDATTFTAKEIDPSTLVYRYRLVPLGTPHAATWLNDRPGNISISLEPESSFKRYRADTYGEPLTDRNQAVRAAIVQGRPVMYMLLERGKHGPVPHIWRPFGG